MSVTVLYKTGFDAEERLAILRLIEAILFASAHPVSEAELAARIPESDIAGLLQDLQTAYAGRGIVLMKIAGGWAFRTAPDLAAQIGPVREEVKKLSRAALEVLAIIAYHQPVTRAEIEDIRGVSTAKGTLDTLLETGWVRLRGRRRVSGRPVTYGTTPAFLEQFTLERIDDLPGLEELKGAGFLDGRIPAALHIPSPDDATTLRDDEEEL